MHIHYELPVAGFLQFLLNCIHERKTGITLFFSQSSEWGKIVISQGRILSVRFKDLNGLQALPLIQSLELVQYHFRPEDSGHIALIRDHDIDNERFFNYFGINLQPSSITTVENDTKSAVLPAANRIVNKIESAKILIADDSPTARKAISKVLIEVGHQVVEARNGFETLGQIKNERPDLLLLDLIMPGIDGYAVLKAIDRNEKIARSMPIVVLTSRDSLLDKLKGMMLNCDAYLIKPINANILLETTNKLLARA